MHLLYGLLATQVKFCDHEGRGLHAIFIRSPPDLRRARGPSAQIPTSPVRRKLCIGPEDRWPRLKVRDRNTEGSLWMKKLDGTEVEEEEA